MVYVKLSRHLHGGTEKNREKPQSRELIFWAGFEPEACPIQIIGRYTLTFGLQTSLKVTCWSDRII
jgi:hypothetical protein